MHVGYHKTASSWLQDCVFPHVRGLRYADPLVQPLVDALATAPDEEFCEADLRKRIDQLGTPRLLISHEGLSGSLWDGYGAGPRNARRLHAVLPEADVLIVVRRQDEMLRSIYAQYVNEGGTRVLRDFVAGFDVEGSRFSLRHLEYDRLVSCYVALFGADRVWVAPYEQLRAQPAEFLSDLCDAVGAQLPDVVPSSWPNRSLSRPCLWLLRTWNLMFRASRFNAAPRVRALPGGRRIRRALQGRVDDMVHGVLGNPLQTTDAALLAEAAANFDRSNQRLQRFCRQPLARWGYPLPGPPRPGPRAQSRTHAAPGLPTRTRRAGSAISGIPDQR